MRLVQGYTQSILVPQLRSLGLAKRQWEIVAADVTQRLESLLSHWSDVPFRRAVLAIGAEEATFWEPGNASLDIRSLVVVAVRNSLITDLNATRAYTMLRLREFLPDQQMPWITGEAIKYFQAVDLDTLRLKPKRDLFGSLSRRFPNAWHALSFLGNSSDKTAYKPAHDQSRASGFLGWKIERNQLCLFFSLSFKWITRNPEKLLSIIEHILRFGGTVVTPKPFYRLAARRDIYFDRHTSVPKSRPR